MNDREIAAVLAGLRTLQNVQQHEALAPEIMNTMTNGGSLVPLSDIEIDALCEDLNSSTPMVPDVSAMWAFVQQVARLSHSGDPEMLGPIDPDDSHVTLDKLVHKARALAATVLA
ncbi:hypothetical protein ACWGNZ_07120 [Sphingomonas zeae]